MTWTVHVPLQNSTLTEAIENSQESCGLIVGRNVDNVFHASVAYGAVSFYQFWAGERLINITSLNSTNFTEFTDTLVVGL